MKSLSYFFRWNILIISSTGSLYLYSMNEKEQLEKEQKRILRKVSFDEKANLQQQLELSHARYIKQIDDDLKKRGEKIDAKIFQLSRIPETTKSPLSSVEYLQYLLKYKTPPYSASNNISSAEEILMLAKQQRKTLLHINNNIHKDTLVPINTIIKYLITYKVTQLSSQVKLTYNSLIEKENSLKKTAQQLSASAPMECISLHFAIISQLCQIKEFLEKEKKYIEKETNFQELSTKINTQIKEINIKIKEIYATTSNKVQEWEKININPS